MVYQPKEGQKKVNSFGLFWGGVSVWVFLLGDWGCFYNVMILRGSLGLGWMGSFDRSYVITSCFFSRCHTNHFI
jgi:hypothetical protein